MAAVIVPSTHAYREVVLKNLNLVFGKERSKDFWRGGGEGEMKGLLEEKFGDCLEGMWVSVFYFLFLFFFYYFRVLLLFFEEGNFSDILFFR